MAKIIPMQSPLLIWISILLIGIVASLLLWMVFPLIDKWGSEQAAGVRAAARSAVILFLFFGALGISIWTLLNHNIPQVDFTLYYPIWMVPYFVTGIVAAIRANRAYRTHEEERILMLCAKRIRLSQEEQLLYAARVYLFRGFETDGRYCTLVVTSCRLIFEPASNCTRRAEQFGLGDILSVNAKNTCRVIPDRIEIVFKDANRKLDFTIPWARHKIIRIIRSLIEK
jgi:hypothetical protein